MHLQEKGSLPEKNSVLLWFLVPLLRSALSPAEQFLRRRRHEVRLEAELSLEFFERCRRPERFHADNAARPANVSFPSESRCLLHRDTRRHLGWQDLILILLCLMLEDIPGRHRDHARADALSAELLVRLHRETDFTPRGDKNHFRVPA